MEKKPRTSSRSKKLPAKLESDRKNPDSAIGWGIIIVLMLLITAQYLHDAKFLQNPFYRRLQNERELKLFKRPVE